MRVAASGGSVRLENATTTTYRTFTAHGDPTQLAQVLDALRKDPQGRQLGQGSYVKVTGAVRDLRVRVYAPLEVRGRIGGREVSLLLGPEPGRSASPARRRSRFRSGPFRPHRFGKPRATQTGTQRSERR